MRRFTLLLVMTLLCAGCAADTGGSAGDPAETVERYLQAKVTLDADTIRGLLCTELESTLEREINTFRPATGVEIEAMTCNRVDGQDVVSCSGQMVADYGGEDNIFPLVSYRVVQEDGEWKWCGEAASD